MEYVLYDGVIMRKHTLDYTVSHDPKYAAFYSHRLYVLRLHLINSDILCIMDEDKTHYPFLKQWVGMEIDIKNKWSINNGTLGLEVLLHKDGRHKMKYMTRIKLENAKVVLKTPYNCIGICDDRQRILLPVKLPAINDLMEFYRLKINTDNFVKKNNLSPKGWSIE